MGKKEKVKLESREEQNAVQCLNCGKTFEGEFCPYCGQKRKTKRLKANEIAWDFINSFLGGDNKFLRTLRGLSCRPGHMVREYLLGHRAKYYNPLQMLIFIITFYAIISWILGDNALVIDSFNDIEIDKEGMKGEDAFSQKVYASFIHVYNWLKEFSKNKIYSSVFASSVEIIPFWLLFYRCKIMRHDGKKLPLNIIEQFYVQMYHSCMKMLFALVVLPFGFIHFLREIIEPINSYSGIIFNIILYKQILGIGWLKSSGLCIITSLILGVMIISMVIAGAIIMALTL